MSENLLRFMFQGPAPIISYKEEEFNLSTAGLCISTAIIGTVQEPECLIVCMKQKLTSIKKQLVLLIYHEFCANRAKMEMK